MPSKTDLGLQVLRVVFLMEMYSFSTCGPTRREISLADTLAPTMSTVCGSAWAQMSEMKAHLALVQVRVSVRLRVVEGVVSVLVHLGPANEALRRRPAHQRALDGRGTNRAHT